MEKEHVSRWFSVEKSATIIQQYSQPTLRTSPLLGSVVHVIIRDTASRVSEHIVKGLIPDTTQETSQTTSYEVSYMSLKYQRTNNP